MFTYNKDELLGCTAMALGNFDGLHPGHISVLKNTLDTAEKNSLIPAVLLFDVHPKKYMSGASLSLLMDEKMRDEMLLKLGFRLIKLSFEKARNLSPDEFLAKIYCKFNVRSICCGFNYNYGKDGSGNVDTLKSDCKKYGISLSVSEAVDFGGCAVSSTRIRKAVESGNLAEANKMLGREFSFVREVIEGDARGRLLGFPTINQSFPDDFVKPRFGVYASAVRLPGEKSFYPGVTNIGIRPTIKTSVYGSETHIFGFEGNLYHRDIEVRLLEFMRDEQDFGSLEKLVKQITADSDNAKQIFEKWKNLKI